MSEAFRSAVAFRNDICDTLSQLEQRLTRPLPGGATVYVTGADALYRLVKNLGTSFDTLAGSVIEIPADGSTNRWVQESASGASPWSSIEVSLANVNVSQNAPNAWIGLGTTAGSFGGGSTLFEVNPTTSVMTYRGITRQMTLEYNVTMFNNSGGAINAIEAVISHNGDVPTDSTSSFRGNGQQAMTLTNGTRGSFTGKRSVLLAPNQTVRLMLRDVLGTTTLTIEYFSMSFAPN